MWFDFFLARHAFHLTSHHNQVCSCTGASFSDVPPNLGAQFRRKLSRFLRCAALFHHFYTDVPLPPALSPGAEEVPSHEQLCRYLGLPETVREFLLVLGVQDIMDRYRIATHQND